MIIACAKCHTNLYRVDGLQPGVAILASDAKGIGDIPDPQAGDKMVCPICGNEGFIALSEEENHV